MKSQCILCFPYYSVLHSYNYLFNVCIPGYNVSSMKTSLILCFIYPQHLTQHTSAPVCLSNWLMYEQIWSRFFTLLYALELTFCCWFLKDQTLIFSASSTIKGEFLWRFCQIRCKWKFSGGCGKFCITPSLCCFLLVLPSWNSEDM